MVPPVAVFIFFSETKVTSGPRKCIRRTPECGSIYPRHAGRYAAARFDLCTEILSGVEGKIEGVSQTERMSRDCGRVIGDERPRARIPLKSYHRLRSAPASSPRLIFQAKPVNLLKAYDSGEILYDIPPAGYFIVSPRYLLSKQRSLRLRRALFTRTRYPARSPTHTFYAHAHGCMYFSWQLYAVRRVSLHFCHDLFRSVTCSFCSVTVKSHDCTNQFENRYSKLTRHNSHAACAI